MCALSQLNPGESVTALSLTSKHLGLIVHDLAFALPWPCLSTTLIALSAHLALPVYSPHPPCPLTRACLSTHFSLLVHCCSPGFAWLLVHCRSPDPACIFPVGQAVHPRRRTCRWLLATATAAQDTKGTRSDRPQLPARYWQPTRNDSGNRNYLHDRWALQWCLLLSNRICSFS